jgi:hypothetical protein
LTVNEEVETGSKVGTVEAVDEDIGENGMIDYLITCKLLSVNARVGNGYKMCRCSSFS